MNKLKKKSICQQLFRSHVDMLFTPVTIEVFIQGFCDLTRFINIIELQEFKALYVR